MVSLFTHLSCRGSSVIKTRTNFCYNFRHINIGEGSGRDPGEGVGGVRVGAGGW